MTQRTVIAVVLSAIALIGICQNTMRQKLKVKPPTKVEEVEAQRDTTRARAATIKISGYEKTQSQRRESMFVTNGGTDSIQKINITVTYLDKAGRQLHKRTESVKCPLPPSETCNVSISSWDGQQLWYYVGTQGRHNRYGSPFDVRIRINYVEF